MTATEILPWLSLASLILAIGTSAWTILKSPSAKLEKRVETEVGQLDRRMDHVESRTAKIEVELEHMPTRDGAHRLELAVTELNGKMEVLHERLKPVAAIADRMQDLLLHKGN